MVGSRWATATLIIVIVLIPFLIVTQISPHTEVCVLTTRGTVTEAQPVNYMRSPEFFAKGKLLKIVLRLWANQQIDATIEIARILGYYIDQGARAGEQQEVGIFGIYPEKVMNRTTWDFHREYTKTFYTSLERVPSGASDGASLILKIEIFLEGPNYSSNPTFRVYWEITVFDVR